MNSITNVFYCKTSEGYVFKSLCELLKNNVKQGCMQISSKSVKLRMTDTNKKILIDMELLCENFLQFRFNDKKFLKNNGCLYVGISLLALYNLVRETKKKDSIELYIREGNINELFINILPNDGSSITTGKLKIQDFQSLDIDIPDISLYPTPRIIKSNNYSKIIKSLIGPVGGNTINISTNSYVIKFIGDFNGMCSRKVVVPNDSNLDSENMLFNQDFNTEQLYRISKISSLGSQLQVYQNKSENLPLFFKTNIGNLGVLKIFIKDKEQIEEDNL